MTRPPRPIVPLRAERHGTHAVRLRVPGGPSLLADGLAAGVRATLLALRDTSSAELRAVAEQTRTAPETAEALMRLARAAEEHAWPLRPRPTVAVIGEGPLPSLVRQSVQPWSTAAPAEATPPPALVVPVSTGCVPVEQAQAFRRAGSRVLPVIVRDDLLAVGPLLGPAAPPCARCVEMHRNDRDPRTAAAVQIDRDAWADQLPVVADGPATLMAAGIVGLVVRCLALDVPLPPALSWSVVPPYPLVRHHRWSAHPRCGCETMEA